MRGVIIRKSTLVHEDERRKIVELLNGDVDIKNLKILYCKKGNLILGNHWHTYPEVTYMMKGKAHYKLKHILTKEEMEFDLNEGELMIKTGFITHTGKFEEDSVVIDASAESWVGEDYNHVREEIWND